MKHIKLKDLGRYGTLQKVIIESLDLALYRVLVELDGEECLLEEKQGKTLVRHNQNELRELLSPFPIKALMLRHQSAYDEMVGQPPKTGNMLEVPLGRDMFPEPKTLH